MSTRLRQCGSRTGEVPVVEMRRWLSQSQNRSSVWMRWETAQRTLASRPEENGHLPAHHDNQGAAVAKRARTLSERKCRGKLRVEDVCVFVGVGTRTLQRCFAAHVGMSPKAYILERRLNLAGLDLLRANFSKHLVSTVAQRNGFSHLGRFSVTYRARFGELPSETLAATTPKRRRWAAKRHKQP